MSAPAAEPLPRLFAAQAARTPAATAVIDGARTLDYAALDRRADRIARLLRAAGTRRGDLVGVRLRRGPDLVAALLGVWKAGAAYVPLDPDHPAERTRWIVEDTGARLIVTDRSSWEGAPGVGTPVFTDSPDGPESTAADTAAALPVADLTGDDAAYVIYTSGSTGRPKGVVVGHGAIANRVGWTVRTHGFGAADRVLQKTTLSFDAAGWEIFAPLVSGGTVVLAPADAAGDPGALLRAVAEHDVSVLQVVPSQLRLLVDEPGWSGCRALRLLFSAGEPLDASLCELVRKRREVEIWNTYGPTECAIDVTAHQVAPEQVSSRVPIGRPISGVRIRVLDARGEPTPIGAPGELCAGGAGLARGYLGRPALTAESFVPDPYGPPGSRMYRTGDRARWTADGVLEYQGRLDAQVKVNGVRIEPGEVEAALAEHPRVRAAVAGTSAGPDGAARLVAYVVGRDGEVPADALRDFLRGTLPGTHVPSVFVPLPALPTLPNGKVDRAALPAPSFAGAGEEAAGRPPTAAERLVARAWTEILGVEDVAPDDDFFQRGGSSLLLARLAAALGAAAGGEVPVHRLFGTATVAEQARLLETVAEPVATVPRAPRGAPLPLSAEQHPLWFLDRMDPGNPEWVTPLLVRLPGEVPAETVRRALALLAGRHEILRTRYLTVGGEPAQVIDEEPAVTLRIVDAAAGEDPGRLFAEEFGRGFDLVNGPVWRALLVRRAGAGQLLALAVHHIASDGESSVLLADDLREICAALGAGREPDLPGQPIQYADYAVWQRERMTAEALAPHLDFWREELADLPVLDLPADRARPAVRDPAGATLRFTVPGDLAGRAAELSRSRGTTPFVAYLTVFAALLARWSGEWDVAVGAPVAGRTRPELAKVAGPFHNTVVLRCGLEPELDFAAAMDRVWERDRRALTHRDLPFERVVEEVAPARDLSRTPLYQVMYNFLDEGVTVSGTADLDPFQDLWSVAKTDLTLFLHTGADGAVTGILEYATALFDEPTIARMAEHFLRLLEAALDDPSATVADLAALADAPRGPVETHLCELWSDLLGHDVGVMQNFFRQGGTSRLALSLAAELQEEFDLDIPVRLVFERPTVARLAEAIRAHAADPGPATTEEHPA
ncbi:non-ribosomal peptide synthetase [Actinomadura algeriensis]|uniref:Amino acid adenylation domain-containing protein n=1 Tax=Actinomadura algeriensis TaxID=1679523 RepID=A0ABR9JU29_9ACTN|nr:non-ribosomal peptide synthetase [Actinomadura algeriensis]MBE1533909.1 amino acid adenylation domain-containing protein [Actinomadura algeriensis]